MEEKKIEHEISLYEYMLLKPLAMIDTLLREEHFAAAQKGMEQVIKNANDFYNRLCGLLPAPEPELEKADHIKREDAAEAKGK